MAADLGMARVLVVDDDPRMARVTAEFLKRDGHAVKVVESALAALQSVRAGPPDLMLLDYDMPGMDGAEVLERLRGEAPAPPFPVIMLTGARTTPGDHVLGLESGAADYVLKGTDRHVLLARVRRALRDAGPPALLDRGRLVIDRAARSATLEGRRLPLQRRPFEVLAYLAERPGVVVTRAELLSAVWKSQYEGFEHSVSQAVYAVRQALGEAGWIVTVHGDGYKFVERP